jgi:hypothetical protein
VFDSVASYAGPANYSNNAINAPINCIGQDTYEGRFAWSDGTFDPNLCANVCTLTTQNYIMNGPPDRPASTPHSYFLLVPAPYRTQRQFSAEIISHRLLMVSEHSGLMSKMAITNSECCSADTSTHT